MGTLLRLALGCCVVICVHFELDTATMTRHIHDDPTGGLHLEMIMGNTGQARGKGEAHCHRNKEEELRMIV